MKNKFKIKGDMTELYINCKGKQHTVLIDTEDLEKVNKATEHTYYGKRSGYSLYAYARLGKINGKIKFIHMHRVITDCPDNLIVDHISGISLDNRKENLRVCTPKENRNNINMIYNM